MKRILHPRKVSYSAIQSLLGIGERSPLTSQASEFGDGDGRDDADDQEDRGLYRKRVCHEGGAGPQKNGEERTRNGDSCIRCDQLAAMSDSFFRHVGSKQISTYESASNIADPETL